MNSRDNLFFCISIVLMSISIGIAGTRLNGRLYPILPITVFVAVFLITVLSIYTDIWPQYHLGFIVLLSTFYRFYLYIYPTSFVGADADGYAWYIHQLTLSGSTDSIGYGFYQSAPNYLIHGGVSSLVTGLPVREALVIVPVILGVVIPITAFVVSTRLGTSPRWGVVAAAFTVLIPTTVLYSHNPVAQSISVPIVLTLVLVILVDPFLQSRRTTILTGFLFFVLLFTHKLAPFVITISFIMTVLLINLRQYLGYKTKNEPDIIFGYQLGAIFVCLYYIQWILTNIGRVTIYTIVGIFPQSVSDSTPSISPTHAQPVFTESYQLILLNTGYIVPLLMLAGVGWLIILILKNIQLGTGLLLSVTGLTTGITIASFLGLIPLIPARFLFLGVPLISGFAAVSLMQIHNRIGHTPYLRASIFAIILLIVIVPQAVAITGPADAYFTERSYLMESETEAKVWADDYVDGEIITDDFYANEIPPSIIDSSSPSAEIPLNNFRKGTPYLLNASINEVPSCWFAIRQEPTTYSSSKNYQLKYDIESLVVKDNVVYSSGRMGTWVAFNRQC